MELEVIELVEDWRERGKEKERESMAQKERGKEEGNRGRREELWAILQMFLA